jgi:hypothetical protein
MVAPFGGSSFFGASVAEIWSLLTPKRDGRGRFGGFSVGVAPKSSVRLLMIVESRVTGFSLLFFKHFFIISIVSHE